LIASRASAQIRRGEVSASSEKPFDDAVGQVAGLHRSIPDQRHDEADEQSEDGQHEHRDQKPRQRADLPGAAEQPDHEIKRLIFEYHLRSLDEFRLPGPKL